MRTDMPDYNSDEEFSKGLCRAIKLVEASKKTSGHANFRTGIRVSFDLKYTQYITKQFQRYHWFDYVSSSSMMHRIIEMDFSKCCNKYVLPEVKNIMKTCVDVYNTHPTYENYMRIISNCPMGAELFVRVSTNYEQLATIYKQRRSHKLKEDWGAFIAFIESLPYAKELIIGE
nr:MAG TPA: hypothetical protein [Caudoviricetes sp.]